MNAESGRAPKSQDLCAIEYVFGRWAKKTYVRDPKTVAEVKRAAELEWRRIPQSHIHPVYHHMETVYPWS